MYKNISAIELYDMLQADKELLLLDIRQAELFNEGKIMQAINVSIDSLVTHANDWDLKKTVIVYCQYGITSQKACYYLSEYGYKQVLNLQGGYVNWKKNITRNK